MGFWQFATGGGSGGGSGDVVGPASATDNAIARFDGTTGKLIQNSGVTVADGLTGSVVVGSTGATDLGILMANGTGGSTAQASAATLTAAGSLTIPSAETIEWNGDVGFERSAAGVLELTNGSTGLGALVLIADPGSGNSSINFGGTTSSDGGLVWASSSIQVLNGNRSAYKPIQADYFSVGGSSQYRDTYISNSLNNSLASFRALKSTAASTAGSGSPRVLAWYEVGGNVWTNEGATAKAYFTLPTAAAGYQLTFVVQDTDGMRIVANTGDTIRVIDKVTAAAGYIESTTIGSVVTLVSINAVEWYATSIHGVWTDGTFTYDDTSLTTP